MILQEFFNHKVFKKILNQVAAGSPGEVKLLTGSECICIPASLSGYKQGDLDVLEAFQVLGDSMAIENIHKADILLAKKLDLSEKTQIKNGDVVIFKVDKDLYVRHYPETKNVIDFKLRKFCDYINLSLDDETILSKVRNVIGEVEQTKYKEQFLKKVSRAREDFKEESLILLSVTYLYDKIDFSMHPLKDLYAKVEYIATVRKSEDCSTIVGLTPIDTNIDQRVVEAIEHLAENKIDRYISGSKESFRTKILASIFRESRSCVRCAFNVIGDLLGNNELLDALKSFLERKGSVKILIYIKPENGLDRLFGKHGLSLFNNQLSVKTSNGVKFTRDNIGITFCVGDESMYVLKPDASKALVECNFNNVNYCRDLINLFDKHFISQDDI